MKNASRNVNANSRLNFMRATPAMVAALSPLSVEEVWNLSAFAMLLRQRGSFGPSSKRWGFDCPYIRIKEREEWGLLDLSGMDIALGIEADLQIVPTKGGHRAVLWTVTGPEDIKSVLLQIRHTFPGKKLATRLQKTVAACDALLTAKRQNAENAGKSL